MKKCNKCLVEKPFTEFFKDKKHSSGYYSVCKQCKTGSTLQWREENREKYNSTMRRYNKKHYSRLRIMRYKITIEQYQKMLSDQKGVCAICGKLPQGKRPLAIDHCHEKGHVRGLLCYGCNRAIHILDTPGLLAKAQEYLQKSLPVT